MNFFFLHRSSIGSMMITSDMVAAIDAASAANEDPENDASNEVGVDDGLLTNQKLVFQPKEEETTEATTSCEDKMSQIRKDH